MFILPFSFVPALQTTSALAPLDILKLVGFATGTALHFTLCWMLWQRYGWRRSQRVLLALGATTGLWHLGNFAVVIYELLALPLAGWWRKGANILAYTALALLPPLLAHAHAKLFLWFDPLAAQPLWRKLARSLAWLGYIPLAVLPYVFQQLWREPYEPPIERLGVLLLPFILWFVFVFVECAALDWRMARRWEAPRERQFFKTFATMLLVNAGLFLLTYVLGARHWPLVGRYLDLFAKLSSISPTAIVAYYIYRYRYFELVFRQSVLYALFAATVMMTYIYGIRRVSLALETRYGVRAAVIEALLILVVIALAEPLRRVVERYLHRLFTREVGLYRELVTQVGAASARLDKLADFIEFAEAHLRTALELREVRILIAPRSGDESATAGLAATPPAAELCRYAEARQLKQLEDAALLRTLDAIAAYVLWREGRVVGLLIIRDEEQALTAEKRDVLSVLSGHIAVALENCQLLETNLALARELAERERLATLGQMAATIAHEVKNPLSAIKSIAQVMREDEQVSQHYARDLDLITGEVDRLSRSVGQLLNFSRPASTQAIAAAPASLAEIVNAVERLTQAEAIARRVTLSSALAVNPLLSGAQVAPLQEILLNLTLNALQAIAPVGASAIHAPTNTVSKATARSGHQVMIASLPIANGGWELHVTDTGSGIAPDVQAKIFTPFFTTKQRGAGLGLAIVARNVRALGAAITCASPIADGQGTRFVVSFPPATR